MRSLMSLRCFLPVSYSFARAGVLVVGGRFQFGGVEAFIVSWIWEWLSRLAPGMPQVRLTVIVDCRMAFPWPSVLHCLAFRQNQEKRKHEAATRTRCQQKVRTFTDVDARFSRGARLPLEQETS